ncbi:TolC family protein [Hydrogenimonas urashimensis]|uniref:TolC family protein n=1 Tax=Hydrogenimonas urashimensis TaxID=2740515 RepID=UPI001914EE6F|nr:TolC family protein [Hydrogenimonas urashimensis]
MKSIIAVFFAFTLSSWADTLTLDKCIDMALKTHPDIKAWLYKTEQAKKDVSVQKSLRLPQVTVSAEYDPQRTYVMPQLGTFHTIDDDGWSVGAQLRQKVYDFSQTTGHIEAAKSRKEIARLSSEEAKALMRYRVKTAYALVLVQKAALIAREKDLAAKKALYEQAKALYAQGLKTHADEIRFYASAKAAEDALAQAQAAFTKARDALAALIGQPVDERTTLQEEVLTRISHPLEDLNTTLSRNLQLRIAQKSIDAAKAEAKAAEGAKFGSVEAFAQASHVGALNEYDTTLLGIGYTLPLYSGGRLSAQAQRAKIEQLVAASQNESAKRAIVQEFQGLLADLQAAKRGIEARKAQERAMEESKRLIDARYKAGLETYVAVLDAQASWLDARLGLLSAHYLQATSTFRLEYLNGQ